MNPINLSRPLTKRGGEHGIGVRLKLKMDENNKLKKKLVRLLPAYELNLKMRVWLGPRRSTQMNGGKVLMKPFKGEPRFQGKKFVNEKRGEPD